MTAPRFHVETLAAGVVRLDDAEARHARAARRLSVGDRVALFDGRGHEGIGRIVSATRTDVEVAIDEVELRERPGLALTLAVALPKGPRQEMLIEKCTELGVAAVQPLLTERSVASASDHRRRKWRRTTIEAAKQSGQCWLPELNEPRKLQDVLGELSDFDLVIVTAAPGSEPARGAHSHPVPEQSGGQPPMLSLADLLGQTAGAGCILAFVGPEGGWTEVELEALIAAGAQPVSLGPHTLRIETAAIALAAVVHALTSH